MTSSFSDFNEHTAVAAFDFANLTIRLIHFSIVYFFHISDLLPAL